MKELRLVSYWGRVSVRKNENAIGSMPYAGEITLTEIDLSQSSSRTLEEIAASGLKIDLSGLLSEVARAAIKCKESARI